MKTEFTLSQVLTGYDLACQARHLSTHTIADYWNTYRLLTAYLADRGLGDPLFRAITAADLRAFLGSRTVSNKTILNYHVSLSALWTWAEKEGLAAENLLSKIDRPKPESTAIEIFSEADLHAIFGAVEKSRAYSRPGKRQSRHELPTPQRSLAILLLLIDTGMRVTELCELQIHHVDVKNRRVALWGKGNKQRFVPFSPRTGQAIWRYLSTRPEARLNDPLFIKSTGRPYDRMEINHWLTYLGERAGVIDVHPHRFRHTFAVLFLRNGGDIFSLQDILGHSSLDMCRRYLHLAQVDLDQAHRRASPVENYHL